MYPPQKQSQCTSQRSPGRQIRNLRSPFKTPPPRYTALRPGITQAQIQSHPSQACLKSPVAPRTYVRSIDPGCGPSSLTSTISRIGSNCQSTLGRIRADIDALHAHYQSLIRREKAETERARAIAKTLEAERNIVREDFMRVSWRHKKLVQEHIALRSRVVETKTQPPRAQEDEKGELESGKKRKRGCDALARLETAEAGVATAERGMPDCSSDSSETHSADDEAECVDEKPAVKKFKLRKRVWTIPTTGGEAPVTTETIIPTTYDTVHDSHTTS